MNEKKKVRRILKEKLKKGTGKHTISTDPSNFEQALFQDVDGPADDIWREAMLDMFPHLRVPQRPKPGEQAEKD